ncbi:hypothetical protein [Pseudoalteromonas xiamenensis]|uniref:Uncharacterized protein n=1 Tax=Pseudoalteromonas xiamenensis TaxID=882626 RepID=A0A975HMV3_9GAMM|nr:hypothetical protein [Pseudoalteromonas xiamenensis]QTH73511.1 hypothetical protein J5O05_18645 [Pseudoalteromonas xiamenensis]
MKPFMLILVVVWLNGCALLQEHVTPQPELQTRKSFAPMESLVSWHIASCHHDAVSFDQHYRAQKQLQLFFEAYCNQKNVHVRIEQLNKISKAQAWPHAYTQYFQLLKGQESKIVSAQTALTKEKNERKALSEELALQAERLTQLKQQLADLERKRLETNLQSSH